MFLLMLNYRDGALDRLDRVLPGHYAYVDRHVAAGTFLLTGRRVPRVGGVILARAASRTEVEQIIAEDPFLGTGAVAYEVIEIEPTRWALPGLAPSAPPRDASDGPGRHQG
ncbi:YciI family protein [Actinoallomurus sp. NPDC050550]|uniref:YciI family protein n=1 Tax=Actinoallomurus sp. NPDC050550 TaxID=3154937 RepID=UPI0033C4E1A1